MLLKNDKKIIIGYDLANTCSQISYCYQKEECDIATVGTVEGEENYDIPTVLCKRIGTNQWLFGYDAIRFCKDRPEEGILVEDLLNLALDGELIRIDGREYHPATLLALFIKRTLSTVTASSAGERIAAIMFTCQTVSGEMKALFQRIIKTLDFKTTEIYFQGYEESFFFYLTYQTKELWQGGALLLDYRGDKLAAMRMDSNEHTLPKVMYAMKNTYRFAGTDKELLDITGTLCEGTQISSVYLIGEKFGGGWMEESLRYLCTGRRVFQGNNLYSKGACYTILKQMQKKAEDWQEEYIFLGPDKLKANVGMKVQKRGEEAYNALLDAGVNWDRAEECFEFYLKSENHLELCITPLVKCPSKSVLVELDGMQMKPEEMTRLRMRLCMLREDLLEITITDLGFGEFRQASDGKWIKEVEIYESNRLSGKLC